MTVGNLSTPLDIAVMITYFVVVVGFGLYFGRYSSTTKDFFFGGQRFAWWVIAFSAIATTVGSYSFVKYSAAGFSYGISSTQSYLNDWFWVPILLLVWLPIIYYQRIKSIPEYFERRFGRPARMAAMVFILLYLVGYVGINLLTLGTALQSILGWPVFFGASVACLTVTLYVFAGGQTSVIMTDLVQGITLLIVGLAVFLIGVAHLGGFARFWALLPEGHRYLFSAFNAPDKFSFIGIYAQDGLANTGAFVLMNQGMVMRFLALRSVHDARRMSVVWLLVLAPLAAITVSGGGWIARALMENGELDVEAKHAFVQAAAFLCRPGIFGFVLAALMAALMSTADTLINAVSAVFVNDIYRPYVRENAPDRHYLRVARITSLSTAAFGLALVPLFSNQSIYSAHGMFTAAVTPPIVMAILLGVLWPRYTPAAAMATLVGGGILVAVSLFPPFDAWLLPPFSFGMGPDSYKFTRALYGLVVSGVLGVVVTFFTRPLPLTAIAGLVSGTQLDAMRKFKGGEVNRRPGRIMYGHVMTDPAIENDDLIGIPAAWLPDMAAETGDLVYVCDRRWWFGGLRSVHGKVGPPSADDTLRLSPGAMARGHFKDGEAVYIEKAF